MTSNPKGAGRKSQSRYPFEMRRYVFERYDRGVKCSDIHKEVLRRWPEWSEISANSIFMMVGSRARKIQTQSNYTSLKPALITLAGPEWSWPESARRAA